MSVSRRDFVGRTALAGAALALPRSVHGLARPSWADTVRVACIGVGGRGWDDMRAIAAQPGVQIVALCDVDSLNLERAATLFPQAARYSDFREMMAKSATFDAVVIATPDHTHAVAAMAALKAGKHVYCEKPLARTVSEVRALKAEAARRPKQITQMGNQGHANEGIRLIREWVEAGAIGTVQRVEFWTDRPIWPQAIRRPTEMHYVPSTFNWDLWLGPSAERPYHPRYAHFNWRGWWDFGTGAMGDMACHIMDAAVWTLQVKFPSKVTPESTPLFPETAPASTRITFDFPVRGALPPVQFIWRDGTLSPPRPEGYPTDIRWPFDGSGQLWVGDKGMLVAGTYAEEPRLLDSATAAAFAAKPLVPKYPRTPGVHAEFVNAMKGVGTTGSAFHSYAGTLTEMIVLGNLAVRSGRTIELDPDTGILKTGGIPNEFIAPPYRAGWTL
ncbi:MAG: Gfo/Idh/MocA family oxidoreductase [Gemmatimonadaceae bacterium]|nr:Gfo/Idh/MocA family oxidoreductase [Gemmatimonadaceae bacterium]